MTLRCDELDADAPATGCACRSCCRARERLIDPELWKLINSGRDSLTCAGIAAHTIHQGVTAFISGRLTLDKMNVAIIKALAEQNDKLYVSLSKVTMSSRLPMFVVKDKP